MTRRTLLRRGCTAALAGFASHALAAATRPLAFHTATLPDPDGHHAALRLKGDWLVVAISDGAHTGLGEISHSNADTACTARARELFERHIGSALARGARDLAAIETLDGGAFATASDFVTATAISGLNQALLDLIAQQRGVPVWRLFRPEGPPARLGLPCYCTLNRALRERSEAAYLRATADALALGARAVKCAPFEAVVPGGDHVAQAQAGFARLAAIRREFPDVALRVDCHERFTPAAITALLPRFEALGLAWIEEPFPPGPALRELRARTKMPLAIGELFFGEARFRELLAQGWADVIMPDPKHVGGFGPLAQVCRMAEKLGGQVSPHNPSGPVAAAAALQAAALSPAVTSLELILTSDPARQPCRELLRDGALRLPDGPGWGLPEPVRRALAAR